MSAFDSFLDPAQIANGISSGDLYFPNLTGDVDYVPELQDDPNASPIQKAGAVGGGDFFNSLLSIGGDTILSGAKALGVGFSTQLANALSGNTDANERATFETAQATQQGFSVSKTWLYLGGALVGLIGLLLVITRR